MFTTALAAIAVGFELEVSFDKIAEGLNSFTGAGRRFQAKGEVNDVLVVDDYGHHPTEVRATPGCRKVRFRWSSNRRFVSATSVHENARSDAGVCAVVQQR